MNKRDLIILFTFFLILCQTLILTPACSPSHNQESFALQSRQSEQKPDEPDGNSTSTIAVVKSVKANLRHKPSRSGAIVKAVEKDDRLALITPSPVGPWYRVREINTGSEGWIHGNVIALQYPSPAITSSNKRTETRSRKTESQRSYGRSYINVDGERVSSPIFSSSRPAGASARCRDGSYSFSRNRRGTCSHHGGVAVWL